LAIPHSIIVILLESVDDNITNLGDGNVFVKQGWPAMTLKKGVLSEGRRG
jgi:hypothetical protein